MDIGIFGKLPSHGDFLRRRVSTAFVEVWDAWLQSCLTASQEALGARWLDLYLTSPIWRFLCAAGACGGAPVIGLMVPSVDRVGRYFPFTVVAELPEDVNLLTATSTSSRFFHEAEQLVLETLEADRSDFDAFDRRLSTLRTSLEAVTVAPRVTLGAGASAVLGEAPQLWQVPVGASAELGPIFEQLCFQRLATVHKPLVLWWTEGSSAVEPSCLVSQGLPAPGAFAALLDGDWAQARWRSVPVVVDTGDTLDATDTGDTIEMAIDAARALAFRSASASDVGLVRSNNEDAFLERPEVGLWVVADGLGGHREGEVASRMVCDAMAELQPLPTFEETLYAVRERLQSVNEHLLRSGSQLALTDRSATTVVVLLARGTACAVLWAGDSRVYRYRAGVLERMSRDHSIAEEEFPGLAAGANAITRAVGIHPTLTLDLVRDRIRAGDRFLLCSDGLTRNVPEAHIEKWLQQADLEEAVRGLIRDTLAAGAPDNVTIVVTEAFRSMPDADVMA